MSINGLNSNQILTLMQLESGKTYTFVGTTGNYSDYMCVTAGMFEAPKKEFSSFEILIGLSFSNGPVFYVSLPGGQEYSWDVDNSYLAPANMSDSLYDLRDWTTYFKNNSNYLFSFTPSEQSAFIPKYTLEGEELIFSFTNRFNEFGAPTIYANGIQQTAGQEASLKLGQHPSTINSIYQQFTAPGEDAYFIFNYPLYINTGSANSFEDYGTILTGLNGGSFDYMRDIEFVFGIRIRGFYSDPEIYNGFAGFSHSSTYSENGTKITRHLTININSSSFWFRTV